MKKMLLFIVMIMLAGCSQSEQQTPQEIILSKEIGALTRWSNGDPWGFIELAAPDITYFGAETDSLIVGYDAFKTVNAAVEGQFKIPTIKIRNPNIAMHDNIGILTYTLINLNADSVETARYKSTKVYKKFEKNWKLVHSHWSIVK